MAHAFFRSIHPTATNATTALGLLLTACSWWFHIGPFRWLTALQLAWFGEEEFKLTLVFSVLICLLPLMLLAKLLTKLGYLPANPTGAEPSTPPMVLGIYAVAMLAAGSYLAIAVKDHAAPRPLTIREIETGAESLAVESVAIDGHLQPDIAMALTMRGHVTKGFIPLVSADWKPGMPVSVLLQVGSRELESFTDASGTFEGTVVPGGLPGVIIHSFEASAIDISGASVVEFRGSVKFYIWLQRALLGIGALLGLAALIAYVKCKPEIQSPLVSTGIRSTKPRI
jgi:hypothetical protein